MTEDTINTENTEEAVPASPTVEEELQEYKDKNLRLLAEIENTRKRLQKEKVEMTRFSVENVIAEFLIPMDNLENALGFAKNMSEETANWARGFQMILNQFKDVVASNGITPFSAMGQSFDPHLHEAVEIDETTTEPDGTILQEYAKGYKSSTRTIRPAKVKVAKKPAPKVEIPEGDLAPEENLEQ